MTYSIDPSATGSPVHVLIVEDERDYVVLLEESLREALRSGCVTRHALTLGSAISELKTFPAEVILLDLNLPDSLGLDTIRAMHSAAPNAAILVVTGSGSEYLARLMLRGGAQDFLTKDEIQPATLRRAISYAFERKRTENELRNSRTQVRQLEMSHSAVLRATTAALASLRYDYSIVWSNDAMNQLCAMIGKPAKSLEDLFPSHAEFAEYTQIARRRAKEPVPFRKDLVLNAKDGQNVYCELTLVPLDPTETSAGYLATVIDVSDRARAENQRESLMRLSGKLTGVNTLKEFASVMADECRGAFQHDAFGFSQYEEASRTIRNIYFEDLVEGNEPTPIEVDGTELFLDYEPQFATGRPKLINRSSADEAAFSALKAMGNPNRRSLSLMFAPIKLKNRVIGVLSVHSYSPARYTAEDLSLLQSFADQCGVVMARLSAEGEVRQQEALYRGIVHDQTELIGRLTVDGRIKFANRALAGCLGHTYQELVGRSIYDYLPPEDRRRVQLHLSLLSTDHSVSDIEHGVLAANGEVQRFVWTYRAIFEDNRLVHYQMVGTDVTRLRIAESALARTEQRLELIVRQIPGILYTLDADLNFTSLMGRGVEVSESRSGAAHSLIGTKLTDLLNRDRDPRDEVALEAHHLALRAGITADFVVVFNDRQYQTRVEPLRTTDNEICGVVGVALDITDQIHAEQEQQRLEKTIQQNERLAEIGRAIATIGHCMKNMITGLNGAIFLVDRCSDSMPAENSMLLQAQDLLRRSTSRISLLLLNMLDLSREREARYTDAEIPDLMQEVLCVLRASASAEGVVVESVVAPEAQKFTLDADRLHRSLLNLGLNALDALAPGGRLVLAARLAEPAELKDLYAAVCRFESGTQDMVPVRSITEAPYDHPTEPLLRLDIADNGSGMSREVLNQLFQPFFSTKFSRGTGLGLAATLQFVESHHGHIFVRSRENFGTTFTILLPKPKAAIPAPASPTMPVEYLDDNSTPTTHVVAEPQPGGVA